MVRGRPQRHDLMTRRQWLQAAGAAAFTPLMASAQDADAPQRIARPFGPRAPWNVPVKHVPQHSEGRLYVDRLFRDVGGVRPAKFHIATEAYTFPVYDARDSTGPTNFKTYWETNLVGKVPWNPAWKAAPGSDAQLIVVDAENGLEWDYFQVQYKLQVVQATAANLVTGDIRTKEDGFLPSRGSGIPYLAMLVRPHELRQGVIEHALSLTLATISGKDFVPPATKLEFPQGHRAGVPAGMRYALNLSDDDLDRWAQRLPKELTDDTRRSARIVAQALKDYGWFVTDSSPGALFQFECRTTAGKAWDELGLSFLKVRDKEYPRDLLEGLLRTETVVAFVPSNEYPDEWRARPTAL